MEMRYNEIKTVIEDSCAKVGRKVSDVTLIAVTKYVTIEETKKVFRLGIKDLGENREQGFLEKKQALNHAEINWHFIGPLQSRKVKQVINEVDMFHALDRLKIAKEINKRRETPVDCFVQVNVSGEASKGGVTVDDCLTFIEQLRPFQNIRVVGLMTMAPHTEDETAIRQVFRRLRQLRDEIKNQAHPHAPCLYLSMGMSNDYAIAIEEGATHIRLGTILVQPER